jgi:HAD superfamily hydrolase (TIGR01509 family)
VIRAVIFDLDGTLVDSNELHVESWDRAFRKFGKEFPLEALRKQIGKGSDQYLPEFLNEEELRTLGPKIDEFRSELFQKEYLPRVQPFPQVRELFERIKRDDRRIVLASSGKGKEVKHYQKLCHIEDLVDGQTTADDADKSKPHPDIFEAALEDLKLAASEAIVIGDTRYDVEAAQKIGLTTIGFLCGGTGEEILCAAGAIAIYADPAELLRDHERSPLGSH